MKLNKDEMLSLYEAMVKIRDFEETCKDRPPTRFDRTPFYRQMAELEKSLRSTTGLQTKIKMTIAQMILASVDGN